MLAALSSPVAPLLLPPGGEKRSWFVEETFEILLESSQFFEFSIQKS